MYVRSVLCCYSISSRRFNPPRNAFSTNSTTRQGASLQRAARHSVRRPLAALVSFKLKPHDDGTLPRASPMRSVHWTTTSAPGGGSFGACCLCRFDAHHKPVLRTQLVLGFDRCTRLKVLVASFQPAAVDDLRAAAESATKSVANPEPPVGKQQPISSKATKPGGIHIALRTRCKSGG